ncbi:aKG-HExxH-type peptide beta-hydroxylase [Streptomyces griseosporeus]|uniref:aKG-HExxH-type peptide beta-hydroxylase n=1 Tax=Streptomyces griseosporeus TaxID=1910 RepID=UPI0036F8E13E
MTLRAFRIDAPLLEALAGGGGGAGAVRLLADAEYGRRLLLLRAVLDRAREHGGAVAAEVAELFAVLARARRVAPEATRRVLTHPSVGPRLVATWQTLAGPGPAAALPLSEVTAAVALASGLPDEVNLTAQGPGAVLPGVGAAVLPDATPGSPVRLRDGVLAAEGGGSVPVRRLGAGPPGGAGADAPARAHAPGEGETGWWALRVLWAPGDGGPAAGGVVLDDVDPVAAPGVPRVRLGCGEVRAWQAAAAVALRVLRVRHPGYAGEVAAGLRALVPLPGDAGAHRSGSAAERFGGVTLTRPTGPLAFAETLVHEMQHSKLVALMHLVDLLDTGPGPQPLLYAPWRDDPRPPAGLLHGTYAFLSVARFWSVEAGAAAGPERRYDAQVRCARWREAAAETAGTLLAHGDVLTPTGRRFVTAMDAALAGLRRIPLPAPAVREARRQAEEHRTRWRARHPAQGGDDRSPYRIV